MKEIRFFGMPHILNGTTDEQTLFSLPIGPNAFREGDRIILSFELLCNVIGDTATILNVFPRIDGTLLFDAVTWPIGTFVQPQPLLMPFRASLLLGNDSKLYTFWSSDNPNSPNKIISDIVGEVAFVTDNTGTNLTAFNIDVVNGLTPTLETFGVSALPFDTSIPHTFTVSAAYDQIDIPPVDTQFDISVLGARLLIYQGDNGNTASS